MQFSKWRETTGYELRISVQECRFGEICERTVAYVKILNPSCNFCDNFKTTSFHSLRTSHFSTGMLVWWNIYAVRMLKQSYFKSLKSGTIFVINMLNFKTTRYRSMRTSHFSMHNCWFGEKYVRTVTYVASNLASEFCISVHECWLHLRMHIQ